jgi:pimeloyl-ACP methyl ester carboxylesterase
VAIIAGVRIAAVTSVVSLCPPADLTASAKKWQASGVRHSQRDLPDDPTQFRSFDVPQTFIDDALQYSAKEEVKSLTKPFMLFIAMEDEVVPPASTEEIAANAPSPYVLRQPKMGHSFRQFPEQTAIVMQKIEQFLCEMR